MYTLSGLLKHNAAAVKIFTDVQGWNALRNSLEGGLLRCYGTTLLSHVIISCDRFRHYLAAQNCFPH